jgi:hypothetical protein
MSHGCRSLSLRQDGQQMAFEIVEQERTGKEGFFFIISYY